MLANKTNLIRHFAFWNIKYHVVLNIFVSNAYLHQIKRQIFKSQAKEKKKQTYIYTVIKAVEKIFKLEDLVTLDV